MQERRYDQSWQTTGRSITTRRGSGATCSGWMTTWWWTPPWRGMPPGSSTTPAIRTATAKLSTFWVLNISSYLHWGRYFLVKSWLMITSLQRKMTRLSATAERKNARNTWINNAYSLLLYYLSHSFIPVIESNWQLFINPLYNLFLIIVAPLPRPCDSLL